ncbi:Hypothetical protein R9X50_00074300 [Acrodontium crateriforme]|uniref:Mitochondrial carrier n=1 Tax=Acrodontium crateriforme TaxID=150365 RepID=A0AAQ3R797_9PEZI|nr:Hypothetical protein R9X50_00074300 [Acrodontium crateriforme]
MSGTHTQGQPHDRLDGGRGATPMSSAVKTAGGGDISIASRMLSAVSGSIMTSLLVTPLDVVRVRLQAPQLPTSSVRLPSFIHLPPDLGVTACCREVFWVQNQAQFCVASPPIPRGITAASSIDPASVASDCAAEETQRRTFNSTFDGLRKIARNEGVWTLWRGLSPTLAMAIPANVIYFAGYDWLRDSPKSPMANRVSDAYAPLVAGSVARVFSAFAVSPIEMLRTRMQAAQSADGGVLRATIIGLKTMVSNEGYTSLWRGLTLTLWRDVPFSALYWWGYEIGRARLEDARARSAFLSGNSQTKDLSRSALLTDSFIAGAGSGLVAALVTTPFDVGKTRQQTLLHSSDPTRNIKDLPENRTMPRFLWHIYCKEGLGGLFKGWAARCLKVAPACAIMISSYEIGKKMALDVNERRAEKE